MKCITATALHLKISSTVVTKLSPSKENKIYVKNMNKKLHPASCMEFLPVGAGL